MLMWYIAKDTEIRSAISVGVDMELCIREASKRPTFEYARQLNTL